MGFGAIGLMARKYWQPVAGSSEGYADVYIPEH